LQWDGLDPTGSKQSPEASACYYGNGTSDFLKSGETIYQLIHYQLLKKNSVP
jgi:hypothetical protein